MKRTFYLLIPFVIFLVLFSSNSFAVLIAEDKIILFEDDKRIKDNSVVYFEKEPYICKDGVCYITQGRKSYTFLKFGHDADFIDKQSWFDLFYLNRRGCEQVNLEEIELGEVLESDFNPEFLRESWRKRGINFNEDPACKVYPSSNEAYLNFIEDRALYTTIISIPPSDEFGTPRTFKLNLKTREYNEIKTARLPRMISNFFFNNVYPLYIFICSWFKALLKLASSTMGNRNDFFQRA